MSTESHKHSTLSCGDATVEYQSLEKAAKALDRTLACLDGELSTDWRRLAEFETGPAIAWIGQHCTEAEGPHGLLTESERTVGRSQRATKAREGHDRLCNLAGEFRHMLSNGESTFDAVRSMCLELKLALRDHSAVAADLAFDAVLDSERGGGD